MTWPGLFLSLSLPDLLAKADTRIFGRSRSRLKGILALKRTLRWESYVLLSIPFGLVAYFLNRNLGVTIVSVGAILFMIFDSVFSALVTKAFLKPIQEVMVQNNDSGNHSVAYLGLRTTKWMTVSGTLLTIGASALFYIHLSVAMFAWNDTIMASEWLNPYMHASSLKSIFNDIGILVASGILKQCTRAFRETGSMPSIRPSVSSEPPDRSIHPPEEHSIVFDFDGEERRQSAGVLRPPSVTFAAPPSSTRE
jgi:hypothetical protein